jgi:hypothetical protein
MKSTRKDKTDVAEEQGSKDQTLLLPSGNFTFMGIKLRIP